MGGNEQFSKGGIMSGLNDLLSAARAADIDNDNSLEYNKYSNDEKFNYITLELSREFGNKLAFKGGFMLTKIMTETARRTVDVDLSILTDEIYEDIKTRLSAICEKFMAEGVIDKYEVKPEVKPTMSGGVSMYKDGKNIMGVDVGWHDLSYGITVHHTPIGDIRGFEIERMLADKVSAVLSRKRFRRPKDIYDICMIMHSFNFDSSKILDYIKKRDEHSGRPTEWSNFPFTQEILKEYEKAYDKLIVNSVYEGRVLTKPDFRYVYSKFSDLVANLLSSNSLRYWDFGMQCFKER